MFTYIKHNLHRMLVWTIGVIFIGLISYFLPLVISTKAPANQVTQITIVSMMIFLLFIVSLILIMFRRTFEGTLNSRVQDLPADIDDVIKELKVDDLLKSLAQLESDKEHLSLDNKGLKLENERLLMEWRGEALKLVETSPQSSIIMAWLWLQQDIRRTAKQLSSFGENGKGMPESLDEILSALEIDGNIDYRMLADIREMHVFRDRVVYADAGEVDMEVAVPFLRQAFDISKQIANKLSVEQN